MPQEKRPLGLNNPARRAARLNYKAKKAMAKAEKFMSLANNQSNAKQKPIDVSSKALKLAKDTKLGINKSDLYNKSELREVTNRLMPSLKKNK